MKYIYIIIFLFGSFFCFAQEDVATTRITNDYSALRANLTGAWIFNKVSNDVEGSVYLFENWKTIGVIATNKDQNLSLSGLNYDTNSNTFVAKISEDSLYMFNNSDIKEVIINRKKFKQYPETGNQSFFEVLAVSKDVEILKRCEKTLKNGVLDVLTQKTPPDRFVENVSYYFLKDNKLKQFKLSKKPFSKLFGEKSSDIKDYISKNKLSVKKDRNFQLILNYYNTL